MINGWLFARALPGCVAGRGSTRLTLNSSIFFHKYDHITVLAIYFYTHTAAAEIKREREEGRDHNSHSPMTRPPWKNIHPVFTAYWRKCVLFSALFYAPQSQPRHRLGRKHTRACLIARCQLAVCYTVQISR